MKSFIVTVALLLFSASASGEITEVTDPNYPGGENNVTRDTETGLEWLDWPVTADMSFNEITPLLEPGQLFHGWTYASRLQVLDLFQTFGLPVSDIAPTATDSTVTIFHDDGASADFAIQLLGATLQSDLNAATRAFTVDPSLGLVTSMAARDFVDGEDRVDSRTVFHILDRPDVADIILGHALVRSVPEPSSASLCAMLISLLAIRGRRANTPEGNTVMYLVGIDNHTDSAPTGMPPKTWMRRSISTTTSSSPKSTELSAKHLRWQFQSQCRDVHCSAWECSGPGRDRYELGAGVVTTSFA